MGARHGQHPAIFEDMLEQPLWARDIRQVAIQHIFHAGVATAHGVAYHHQIRRGIELGRVIALGQLYALLLELGAHGGIHVGIRAGHPVTELLCQHRQTTHEGAADPENVNVHTAAFSSKGVRILGSLDPVAQAATMTRAQPGPARRQKSDCLRRRDIHQHAPMPAKYGHLTGHRYNVGLQT
ncbi:hypothetical protein D3C84_587100 [compost metagenome]